MEKIVQTNSIWFLFFFVYMHLHSGVPGSSIIVTPDGPEEIGTLTVGSSVVSIDPEHPDKISSSCISSIVKTTTQSLIVLVANDDYFILTPDHLVYDPVQKQWIPAQYLQEQQHLLNDQNEKLVI